MASVMETAWEQGGCGGMWPVSGFPPGLLCGFQPGHGCAARNESLRLGQCVLRGAAVSGGSVPKGW